MLPPPHRMKNLLLALLALLGTARASVTDEPADTQPQTPR